MSDSLEKPSGNFAVFALPSFPGGSTPEADIDENGNRIRRRRKHVKSRAGCASCKERKVKCDERRPSCKNCVSRQLNCSYSRHLSPGSSQSPPQSPRSTSRGSPSKSPGESSSALPILERGRLENQGSTLEGSLNMQPMSLLHHFETHTSETMTFGSELWRMSVIPLALKNDYLMHAVLLMACSHLRYLHPEEPAYAHLESQHLSLTLKGFRERLAEPISSANMDVLISCALLLLHHTWSVSGALDEDTINSGSDHLFALAAGLRSIVEQMWEIREQSIFGDMLCQKDSLNQITEWTEQFHHSYDFADFFIRRSREEPGYPHTDAVESLIPILHVYELHLSGVDVSNVLFLLSKCLFNWSCKYNKSFLAHVQINEPEALLILLGFYTVISRLLGPTTWWLRDRSLYMCQAIRRRFEQEGGERNDRLQMMSDYFDREGASAVRTRKSVSPSHIDPSLLDMG